MNRTFQVVEGGVDGLCDIYMKLRKDKSADKNVVYLADNYSDKIRSVYMGILFLIFTKLPTVGETWVIQTAKNHDELIKLLAKY